MNTLIVEALHRLPVEQHSTSLSTPFAGRGAALQDGWSCLFKRATQLVAGGGGGGGGSSDSRNGGDGDDGNGTGKDCDDSGTFRQNMMFAMAKSQVEADKPCRRLPVGGDMVILR